MTNLNAPRTDADVGPFIAELGLPGFFDLHVHFMPDRVQRKVWAFFDSVADQGLPAWPINYRGSEEERVQTLRDIGVSAFPTLNYAHRPGMAQWLNEYSTQFAQRHSDVIHSGTFFAEPDAESVVADALDSGAKIFKVHIQVGAFSALDQHLTRAWATLADAGVPVVIHCGNGPNRGEFTGPEPIYELVKRYPLLVLIIAHAGLPDYQAFADLAAQNENVYLDTTMVGTAYMETIAPLPDSFPDTIAALPGKIVLGTDFPTIPHSYAHQLDVLHSWGLGADWLREVLWHTPRRLLNLS